MKFSIVRMSMKRGKPGRSTEMLIFSGLREEEPKKGDRHSY